MEIIVLSLIAAIGKLMVICMLCGGVRKMLWWSKLIDVVVLFGLPWLFYGTFSGVILAILSGLWITMTLAALKLFIPAQRPNWLNLSYAKKGRRAAREAGSARTAGNARGAKETSAWSTDLMKARGRCCERLRA